MIIKVDRIQLIDLLYKSVPVNTNHPLIKQLGIFDANQCEPQWMWHNGKLQSLSESYLLHIYELVTNQHVFDWIEINSLEDLPKERGTYHVLDVETTLISEHYISSCSYNRKEMLKYTHWCRKIIPNKIDK